MANQVENGRKLGLPLAVLSLLAESKTDRIALMEKALEAAHDDPREMAPLVFTTDKGDPMVPEPFHREWLHLAMSGPRYVQIMAARGHAKSEYFGLVFPTWFLARHPTRRVLLISSTDDMAQRFSSRIADVYLYNPIFAKIFPDFPEIRRSTQHELYLATSPRDPAFKGCGWGSTVTGLRSDLIIQEDIVTNENSRMVAMREAMDQWSVSTMLPILVPETGRIICAGTPYYEDDLYARQKLRGFVECVYPAIDSSDKLLWGARYPRSELELLREKLGSRAFGTQYLCQRMKDEGEVFLGSWFTIIDLMPEMSDVRIFVDLAMSKQKSADFTAMSVMGRSLDGDVVVIDVLRGQWEPADIKRRLAMYHDYWKHRFGHRFKGVIVEAGKEADVLVSWIHQDLSRINIETFPTGGEDKAIRATHAVPFCEAHRVVIFRGSWNHEFMAEILSFTQDLRQRRDDQTDTLVMGIRFLLVEHRSAPNIRVLQTR